MDDEEVGVQVCPLCGHPVPLAKWHPESEPNLHTYFYNGADFRGHCAKPSSTPRWITRASLWLLGLTPTDWALQALGYSGYKGAPKRKPIRCPTFGSGPR